MENVAWWEDPIKLEIFFEENIIYENLTLWN